MHVNEKLADIMGVDCALVYQYILTELEIANIRRRECGGKVNNGCYIDIDDAVKILGQKLNCVKDNLIKIIKQGLLSAFMFDKKYIYVVIM